MDTLFWLTPLDCKAIPKCRYMPPRPGTGSKQSDKTPSTPKAIATQDVFPVLHVPFLPLRARTRPDQRHVQIWTLSPLHSQLGLTQSESVWTRTERAGSPRHTPDLSFSFKAKIWTRSDCYIKGLPRFEQSPFFAWRHVQGLTSVV